MRSKGGYQLIGPNTPTTAVGAAAATAVGGGLGTGMKIFLAIIITVGMAGLITVSGIVGWTKTSLNSIDDAVGQTRQDLLLVNDTLCDKIMEVNATLQSEVDAVLNIFEAVNMSLYFDLNAALLEATTTIYNNLANITGDVGQRLVSINNVTGVIAVGNVDLVVNGTGLAVQPEPMLHTVFLENTGVVTINDVGSLAGSHNLLLTGTGGITINSYPLTSTIEVDGTGLSTALSNLQMQSNMQQMEIAALETNVTNLQTQVTNLQMVGDMIAQDLNGTTITFNMTVMELLNEVMTLQTTVISLQSQIDALGGGGGNPTGTIVPFAGTVVPTGYLACDGAEYDTTTYNALFTVIGTMYCPGPCTNMFVFAVPDLRGRVPAGQGGTALSGPLGTVVGAETHVLSVAEMPSHTHGALTGADGFHYHYSQGPSSLSNMIAENSGTGPFGTGSSSGYVLRQMAFGGNHQHSFTTYAAGSGTAHNNIQPSLVVKYIIKT